MVAPCRFTWGCGTGGSNLLFLVEDSADDAVLSKRAISKSGVHCDVNHVSHGGEALAMLLAPDGPIPDLIVLDFHLPQYNGLEILRALRASARTRHVPIVMLSALESDEEIHQCLAEGANSCVQKPVESESYTERVALIVRYWLTVDKRPEPAQSQRPHSPKVSAHFPTVSATGAPLRFRASLGSQ
jgi:two-component system, response regulator